MVAEEAIRGLESCFHGSYAPGDFIVANDPYVVRGGHLPDWNFIRPLFFEGEHLGFFQAKTHVSDTGGFLPGGYGAGAYDIIAEGLNIPPLKLMKAGVLQEDVWNLVLRNVRMPTELDMDTRLINGCMAGAEEQIGVLCRKYGIETVRACMREIVAAGERAMRAEIPITVFDSAVNIEGYVSFIATDNYAAGCTAARRLAERGARTLFWHEAALGLMPEIIQRRNRSAATT